MITREVDKEEYSKIIRPQIQYNRVEFNELNKSKVDSVHYILSKDNNVRFGLIYGENDNEGFTPFSAPFGCFANARKKWEVKQLDEALEALDRYISEIGLKSFRFILPPDFYNVSLVTVIQNKLFRLGYNVVFQDLNYTMDLNDIREKTYVKVADRNARRNIKIAEESGLNLYECKTVEDRKTAYEVIRHNREYRGYPLRMSMEQVLDTIKVVPADMFLVKTPSDEKIASALVYHVAPKIAQVIYWGNEPGTEKYKPVNYLAYKLSEYYIEKGYRYLDIGPSTEDGSPNYGLCDFKEKIGCKAFPKFVLMKKYD